MIVFSMTPSHFLLSQPFSLLCFPSFLCARYTQVSADIQLLTTNSIDSTGTHTQWEESCLAVVEGRENGLLGTMMRSTKNAPMDLQWLLMESMYVRSFILMLQLVVSVISGFFYQRSSEHIFIYLSQSFICFFPLNLTSLLSSVHKNVLMGLLMFDSVAFVSDVGVLFGKESETVCESWEGTSAKKESPQSHRGDL